MFQHYFLNFPGIIYEGPLEAFIEKQGDYLERNPDALKYKQGWARRLLMMGTLKNACAELQTARRARSTCPETPLRKLLLAGCGKSAFCSKTEGVHKALLSSEE